MKKIVVTTTVIFVFSIYTNSQEIEKHAPEGFRLSTCCCCTREN